LSARRTVIPDDLHDEVPERDGSRASGWGTPAFAATPLEYRSALVIAIAGELDLLGAPELDRLLREADPSRPALVDFAECEFVDSSGLLVLVRHSQRLGGFAVCCARGGAASQLFELTGLTENHRAGHGAPLNSSPRAQMRSERSTSPRAQGGLPA